MAFLCSSHLSSGFLHITQGFKFWCQRVNATFQSFRYLSWCRFNFIRICEMLWIVWIVVIVEGILYGHTLQYLQPSLCQVVWADWARTVEIEKCQDMWQTEGLCYSVMWLLHKPDGQAASLTHFKCWLMDQPPGTERVKCTHTIAPVNRCSSVSYVRTHIELYPSVGAVVKSEYKQKSQSQIGCLPDACHVLPFLISFASIFLSYLLGMFGLWWTNHKHYYLNISTLTCCWVKILWPILCPASEKWLMQMKLHFVGCVVAYCNTIFLCLYCWKA